jgi:hypothetical protein
MGKKFLLFNQSLLPPLGSIIMRNHFFILALSVLISACLGSELAFADPDGSNSNSLPLFSRPSQHTGYDDPALTAVTREFGPSKIRMSRLPHRSKVAVANQKPWSSWWYPKKDESLFEGSNSPLAKYDLFRKLRYHYKGKPTPRSAAEFEKQKYSSQALAWEGLCDAWSLASILKPEPKRPVTMRIGRESITFTVADLKALLLKTYEAVDDEELKYYGQKFTGDARGWIFPDIYPNEFHRFLEVYLFKKKQAFVMDHDPGPEVWNVPVYKANYHMQAIPGDPNAVFVTAWVYSAKFVQPHEKDFVGTRETVRTYHYVLRGSRNPSGKLVVTSGEWVKGPDHIDSTKDHPDFITTVPNPLTLTRKSSNPEIEIDLVDEILLNSY